jgi:hypothetical protein
MHMDLRAMAAQTARVEHVHVRVRRASLLPGSRVRLFVGSALAASSLQLQRAVSAAHSVRAQRRPRAASSAPPAVRQRQQSGAYILSFQ